MTDEALLKIIAHCVGVIGYFDCHPTKVEQKDGRIVVTWDHYGRERTLIFTESGDYSDG